MDISVFSYITVLEVLKQQLSEVNESLVDFVKKHHDGPLREVTEGDRRQIQVEFNLVCVDGDSKLFQVEEFSRLQSMVSAMDVSINRILTLSNAIAPGV